MAGVEVVFLNTGPLIAFTRVGRMDILRSLPFRFVVTQVVVAELAARTPGGVARAGET